MHIPDDPQLQENLAKVESENYLTRYHACDRILKFFGMDCGIGSVRRVFSLITDKRHPEIINGPEDFQEARSRLLTFIANEKEPRDLSNLDQDELNEQLLDCLYLYNTNDERITDLLAAGANFLAEDKKGFSGFMYTSRHKNRKWMRTFLKKGADINETLPGWGTTVFLINLDQADLDWLKEMVAFGADLQAVNDKGENAAFLACSGMDAFKKVKWLQKQGVSLTMANHNRETVFNQACGRQDVKLVHWLAEQGCDPNPIRKNTGLTPLLHAVKYNQQSLVKALLEVGADPNFKGPDGKNAYRIAMDKGLLEIAVMIKGETALDEFENSKDRERIIVLKKDIITSLKSGKTWTSSDKEGHRKFWWDGDIYRYEYHDHFSDDSHKSEFGGDGEALKWLYEKHNYGFGSETMVRVYETILRRLG